MSCKTIVGAIIDRPQDATGCKTVVGAIIDRPQDAAGCKTIVGAIIDRPQDIELSQYGEIVNEAIHNISFAYPAYSVEGYVIMPNHIHILLRICADECGRPLVAPTVSQVVKQLKGYVSKRVGTTIWQKSFHDHIIRNRKDYEEHLQYIYENPIRWAYDELYTEE